MRLLAIIFVLLALIVPAHSQMMTTGVGGGDQGGGPCTAPFQIAPLPAPGTASGAFAGSTNVTVPAGHTVVVALNTGTSNQSFGSTIVDNAPTPNTYTVVQPTANTTNNNAALAYNTNVAAIPLGTAFKATMSGGATWALKGVWDTCTTGSFDQSQTLNQTTAVTGVSLTTGTMVSTTETAIGYSYSNSGGTNITTGTGFTSLINNTVNDNAYRLYTGGGTATYNPSYAPTSVTSSNVLLTFQKSGVLSYTATGPSTGTVSTASTNFTVTLSAGTFNGSQTITIADGGQGGTVTPSVGSAGVTPKTVTPTSGLSSFTFTYTAAVAGVLTLSFTNAQSWTNPGNLTYTAANTYTATGPSSGTVSTASTNFTVTLASGTFNGSQTITITDNASTAGTITPSVGTAGTSPKTVTPTSGTSSFTFTYTPAVTGVITLAFTNAQSWTNPASLNYTSNSGAYTPQGVNFSSTAYLNKTSVLSGTLTATSGLISFWFNNPNAGGTPHSILCICFNTGAQRITITIGGGTPSITIGLTNSATTQFASWETNNTFASMGTTWRHVLMSWSTTGTTRCQMYTNVATGTDDSSDLAAGPTCGTGSIDYTANQPAVGGGPTGTFPLIGNIADFQFWAGVSVDISNSTDRRNFIDTSGNAVNPSTAATAYGTPCISLNGVLGTGGATWATNKGSCGGFTIAAGTISAASTNPP